MPDQPPESPSSSLRQVMQRIESAPRPATQSPARLIAASKTRSATAVAELASAGQLAFGENYVQEAVAKQAQLPGTQLEWHLIGHLQSNKAREAATAFDWVQTVDRGKLVVALARHRPPHLPPLNVLVQVNIDDEAGKHGCPPGEAAALADLIIAQPRLALRGLMLIPTPHPELEQRRPAFRHARQLFEAMRDKHQQVDSLSMGMSEDLEIAIAEGATMVRVGTALFGPR